LLIAEPRFNKLPLAPGQPISKLYA
jgi:hypothetical protein